MIHPVEQVRRRYSRIPAKPGPVRYPVAVTKQTTPWSAPSSLRCAVDSNAFHSAQRQK